MAPWPPGVVSLTCNPRMPEKFRSRSVKLDSRAFVYVSAAEKKELLFAQERDARRQRIGDQLQFAQLGVREIRAGVGGGLAFARDLDHCGDFALLQDRRAHDLLDGLAAFV